MATNNLESSYKELRKSYNFSPRNFYITRNIPIDIRFLVESIETIDTTIPRDIRYPGLIFFVKDSIINDGTTKNYDGTKKLGSDEFGHDKFNGTLYYFDNDLNPIPLHDLINKQDIKILEIKNTEDDCYSKLLDTTNDSDSTNSLNHLFAKPGSIVFIQPLNILVVCKIVNNKIKWEYLSGNYNISNINQYNNIPNELKKPNTIVNINGIKKIIQSDLTLTDEIIIKNSLSDCTENNRFYNINGFIYYVIDNHVIPISDKFIIKNTSLTIGDNIIHLNNELSGDGNSKTIFDTDFNTINIIVDCIFQYKSKTYRLPLQHEIIDNNTINIISSLNIQDVKLLISAKQ